MKNFQVFILYLNILYIVYNDLCSDYLGKWSSNEDRKKWEDDFSTLINPVTVKIDTMLRNTYDLAVKGILTVN